MCFGGGGSTKKADPVQAYQHNPQNVADTSNDAYARGQVIAATDGNAAPLTTFGSELGSAAPGTTANANRGL